MKQPFTNIKKWLQIKNMAEKVAVAMVLLSIVMGFTIGIPLVDMREFRDDIANLNTEVLPNISTSAELAASLQTTIANVNRLNFAESHAQRRIVFSEIITEMEVTERLAANIGRSHISPEVLSILLTTIKQSVERLNILVENRIDAKISLEQSVVTLIQYDVDFITNQFTGATNTDIKQLGEWENILDQIISKAINAPRLTYMREVLLLKRETSAILENMPEFEGKVSTPVLNHMTSVKNGMNDLINGPDGIFTLSVNYLSILARTRGLENQTTLLTEEASILVSSIFSQTRINAKNYAQEIVTTLEKHMRFLVLSSIFVLITFGTVYIYFRRYLVGRLVQLNEQVLGQVEGEQTPISVEGNDEITDIAKSIGFFISEIDDQQAKLIKAIDQAEKANASKTEFLANISHDIRTPLTGVKGSLSLLENTNLNKKQKHLLKNAKLSSEILHSIINDLLDISRLEKGMLPLHKSKVDIRELINGVVTMMEEMKNEKGLTLETDIAKDIPKYIYTDPKRFTQIFFNLLSNSLKFTENGSIKISLKYVKNSQNNKSIQLQITDTGIGISVGQQKIMFNRFQRFNSKMERSNQSTGLGLSICKYLVELMKGQIKVKSALKKGSTFTVTIPFESLPKRAEASVKPDNKIKKTEKNILIVEDNIINQQLIQMILDAGNHKITLVDNGKKALEKVKSNNFDLVLMDVQMPVMDGKEATKRIRALPQPQCYVPIIALTAHAMDFEADQLISVGMNAIITKPIDTKLLESAVQHYSL